ncbi:hypothetical protein ALO81_101135 [Pseudomonas cannabina]|uniref:Uncharacterized protein n=1 Tax=Pseudomonas cannabina TaxID=86840 RepID=A0A0P9N2F5_PSECA|nr:hypothetical protein ALO81_101135 [Pseudomonas cannabina]
MRFMWFRLALYGTTMPEHNEAKKRLRDHYEKTFISAERGASAICAAGFGGACQAPAPSLKCCLRARPAHAGCAPIAGGRPTSDSRAPACRGWRARTAAQPVRRRRRRACTGNCRRRV